MRLVDMINGRRWRNEGAVRHTPPLLCALFLPNNTRPKTLAYMREGHNVFHISRMLALVCCLDAILIGGDHSPWFW